MRFRPPRLRTLALLGGAVLAVAALPLARAGHPPAAPAPLVFGHRGAPDHAPENTLASIDTARRLGVTWVENDVQRTRDGRLVVIHDATLTRTTDASRVYPGRSPWRVGDLTLAEIERLDAGGWYRAGFAGQRVPTLDAYLREVDHNHQGLLLEIKNPQLYPGLAKDIADRLRSDGWLDPAHLRDRLIVQSFDASSLPSFHALVPGARTALLGDPPVRALPADARFLDAVNPDATGLTASYLAAVHRVTGDHGRPLAAYVWTVDDPAKAVALVREGADGVISSHADTVAPAVAAAAGRPRR